jgi:hypothetical protein
MSPRHHGREAGRSEVGGLAMSQIEVTELGPDDRLPRDADWVLVREELAAGGKAP